MNFSRLTLPGVHWRWGLCVICLCLLAQFAFADPVTDYNVAVEFYKQQRWDLAADACEDFLKRNATDERVPTVRLYWAQSLLHLRKFAEARDQFRRFLTEGPQHPDRPLAQYRLGECSYFLNDFGAAETELSQFLKDFPNHDLNEWGLVYLGESQLRLKKYEQAVQTFQTALNKFPQGRLIEDTDFGLATALDATNQKEQAAAAYERIANRPDSPRAADAGFNLAARLFDQKKFEESAARFRQLAEKYPQHRLAPAAHLNAGYAMYYLGKYQDAVNEFKLAAEQPSTKETALYWTGLSQKMLGEYSQAAQTFSESLAASPAQPLAEKVTFHWGDAEFRLKNFPKAIELFLKVTQTWPNGELGDDALHSACEAALQAGDLARAGELNEQFTKNYPVSGLAQVQELLASRIAIARGDAAGPGTDAAKAAYAQATTLLRHVVEASQVEATRNNARYQLARIAEREGRDADVITELNPIVSGNGNSASPEFLDAILLSAAAHLRLKDSAGAAADYQRFLQSSTREEDQQAGYSGLVSALLESNNWDQLAKTLADFDRFDQKNARFSVVALAAGDDAFDKGAFAPAAACYQKIIARGSENPYLVPALSGLGHSQYELKDFASAAETFAKLAASSPADQVLASHALYMQALSLQQQGNAETSLDLFRAAQQKFTQSGKTLPLEQNDLETAHNAYLSAKAGARVARELNQIKAADALYDAAFKELKLQPAAAKKELDLLINEWADLSYNAQDFDRSDELYRLLVKECPESPLADDAQLILAESLRFGGKPEEALAAFQALADLTSADDFVKQRSLTHLLDLYSEQGEWAKVVEVGKQMEARFPGQTQSFYAGFRQGEGLLRAKQYAESVTVLSRVRDELSKDLSKSPAWWPEVWLLLAEAQYSLKDYAAMDATLADFRIKGGDSPLIYRADALAGRALENQARFPEARVAYSKVIDSESGRGTETAAEAQFRIAESYLKEQNLPVALREYYKVYAGYDAPKYESAALYQAGACDVTMKHFPQAAETFRKLIAEFPDSEFVEKAKARLQEIDAATGK